MGRNHKRRGHAALFFVPFGTGRCTRTFHLLAWREKILLEVRFLQAER